MDKYEYKVRAEEINSLIEQKKFAEAVKIADTIDWRRVKSAKMLCKVSELYKMNRRYEDSKEILLLADEHLPNSRNIIYSLCELSIKLEDLIPAVEYYKQFVQIAPRDTGRYILQYRLYEAQDVSLEERIAVLEEYKKRDYREKWAYELAYLYHRIGLATRCVEECDELILWFGEGKYVIKAMELKMLHAPLTSSQQEKYDQRFASESNVYVVKKPDETKEAALEKANAAAQKILGSANEPIMSSVSMETIPSMPIQIKSVEVSNAPTTRIPAKKVEEEAAKEEEEIKIDLPQIPLTESGEEVDFQIKTPDMGKFNTINLQKELAKNLAAVMQQEDMGASDATRALPIDSLQNMTEEELKEVVAEKDSVEELSTEEPDDSQVEGSEEKEADSTENIASTKEFKPLTDTAVTRAVIDEVRKALGEEPRETITEEDLIQSMLEDKEETISEPIAEEKAIFEMMAAEVQNEEVIPEPVVTEEPAEEIVPEPIVEETPVVEEPIPEPVVEEAPVVEEIVPEPVVEEAPVVEEIIPEPVVEETPVVEEIIPEPIVEEVQVDEIIPEPIVEEVKAVEPIPEPTVEAVKVAEPIPAPVAAGQPDDPDAPIIEKQITGQLSFNDIVAGWEETKKAAEERRLDEMRKKVMAQTGPLLQDYEEPAKEGLLDSIDMITPAIKVFDESSIPMVDPLITEDDEVEELTDIQPISETEELPIIEEEKPQEPQLSEFTFNTAEINNIEEKLLNSLEQAKEEIKDPELEPINLSGISVTEEFDKDLERQILEALEEKEAQKKNGNAAQGDKKSFDDVEFTITDLTEEKVEEEKEESLGEAEAEKENENSASANVSAVDPDNTDKETDSDSSLRQLSKEEKDLFGMVAKTKKVQEEIANAIDNVSLDPAVGNIIITGEKGVGTLELAKNIIKVVSVENKNFSGRVAKVTGEQLNTRNIADTLNGLNNGALIIEQAGELSDFSLIAISDYMRTPHNDGLIIFMEDGKKAMDELLAKDNMPLNSFNLRIDVAALDNDGLVNFGREYALEQEYAIDEMGMLALYTSIANRQTSQHAVTVEEVKQIVDNAIAKSEKGSVSHFMDVILKKRYDENDMIILREKDFL
ncbi:MAG: hypothetical protein PUE95_11690 [Lachnospiraceae bacterium]|nr:hypothetical protein [Lachnospiraceae bacterium]